MDLPPVRLYNTFTRRKEVLQPLEAGVVRMYSCGPTVYRYVHVGNLRTFMLPDLLRRSLEYLGHETYQVMNITDVGHLTDDTFERGEDKMLVSAKLENKTPEEIAAAYTQAFLQDVGKVNIRPASVYPRATDYIPKMIELVERLLQTGNAYEVEGTVSKRGRGSPSLRTTPARARTKCRTPTGLCGSRTRTTRPSPGSIPARGRCCGRSRSSRRPPGSRPVPEQSGSPRARSARSPG